MKIKIKSINVDEFKLFLKKLLKMDDYIYITINKENMSSAIFLPERDAVKFIKVPIDNIFEFEKPNKDLIRLIIYNGSRIIDALNFFNNSKKIEGEIVYNKFGDDLVAEDFIIKNDKLKIKLFCADPNIQFISMSKDEILRAFGTDNALFNFDLLSSDLTEIEKISKFDKDHERLSFKAEDDKLFIEGSNFESKLKDVVDLEDDADTNKITIYKKYFKYLEKENYDVTACNNKIVFKSTESNTIFTCGICLGLDDDEDDI